MSRLRKTLEKIDNLTANDYLEPDEQDTLIELLNSVSLAKSKQYLNFFLIFFLVLTPFYLLLPFFKKQPALAALGLLVIVLNCINLKFFNYYDIAKQTLLERELFNASERLDQLNSRQRQRLALRMNVSPITKVRRAINYYITMAQRKIANEQFYGPLFNTLLVLFAFLFIYIFHYNVPYETKHKYSIDTLLFIGMPMFASATSITINHWISSLASDIDGLKNLKYHEKSV